MRIRCCSATSVGRVRESNEDAYLADVDRRVFAVADGMGGHAAGEVASNIAIGVLRNSRVIRFTEIFDGAHRAILYDAARRPQHEGMGTTLTACHVDNDWLLHIAHAGDSALYARHSRFKLMTPPQGGPGGLDNCLGVRPMAYKGAQRTKARLEEGDIVVLASDGLTRYLDSGDDVETLDRFVDGQPFDGRLAAQLVDYALERGGEDNVTVLAFQVG